MAEEENKAVEDGGELILFLLVYKIKRKHTHYNLCRM
jgi:hypothetical protein